MGKNKKGKVNEPMAVAPPKKKVPPQIQEVKSSGSGGNKGSKNKKGNAAKGSKASPRRGMGLGLKCLIMAALVGGIAVGMVVLGIVNVAVVKEHLAPYDVDGDSDFDLQDAKKVVQDKLNSWDFDGDADFDLDDLRAMFNVLSNKVSGKDSDMPVPTPTPTPPTAESPSENEEAGHVEGIQPADLHDKRTGA